MRPAPAVTVIAFCARRLIPMVVVATTFPVESTPRSAEGRLVKYSFPETVRAVVEAPPVKKVGAEKVEEAVERMPPVKPTMVEVETPYAVVLNGNDACAGVA